MAEMPRVKVFSGCKSVILVDSGRMIRALSSEPKEPKVSKYMPQRHDKYIALNDYLTK